MGLDERTTIQLRWDLWNLRTLFPGANADDLRSLQAASRRYDRIERNVFRHPERARAAYAAAAEEFMACHTELHRGLLLSLHLGPYSLAPVPWLLGGFDVQVLVNRRSLAGIKPIHDMIAERLKLPGRVNWVPIEGRSFALKLARTLHRDGLVLAYIDGNDGRGGADGTLSDGTAYDLPGRRIRVRTGLARLAGRLGCPVHAVTVDWDGKLGLTWRRGPTWRPSPKTDPDATTRRFYDWAFAQIRQRPEQWRCWSMLPGVYDGFRPEDDTPRPSAPAPETALAGAPRCPDPDTRIHWLKPAELWPGDILEDVRSHCFYDADGLEGRHLSVLAGTDGLTLGKVCECFGRSFVEHHLPRLERLGFIGLDIV